MSACLADNHDAQEIPDSENEEEDVKLSGKVDVAEVHRIINMEPSKHKDETYIQRKVREAAKTAMEFTKFATPRSQCPQRAKLHLKNT